MTSTRPSRQGDTFSSRHVGAITGDRDRMLGTLGADSLTRLIELAAPADILDPVDAASLPAATDEAGVRRELTALAARNHPGRPLIGRGYHGTVTPAVIRRNVLENPSWYTAYTPYQPEISQGRLEALINFQQMVEDLTALDVANSSLLDEATAAAEAMLLARRASRAKSRRFLIGDAVLDQVRAVLAGRAEALDIELVEADLTDPRSWGPQVEQGCFGVLADYPDGHGRIWHPGDLFGAVHAAKGICVAECDILALALLTPPGEMGADVAVGSTQRFGVPLGFGGPHAGYMAVRKGLERQLPGRLVGASRDADGIPAYRLALQTREQHIRRDRATSNICTAQVLLAVMAGMYAVWHGPGDPPDRHPGARPDRPTRRGAAGGGIPDRRRTLLRHPPHPGPRRRAEPVGGGPHRRDSPSTSSTTTLSASASTRRSPDEEVADLVGLCGSAHDPAPAVTGQMPAGSGRPR
ncbi:hypothetical protein BWX38_00020 [Acidipropionibacterium acidipropionici]|nr:hypothetical protein BWX38_00020 [Acidipropionibacterium acidipropionici]